MFFVLVIGGLFFSGVGCVRPVATEMPTQPEPSANTIGDVSAKEAAGRIVFSAGDSFEVRQTFFGFGSFLPDITGSTKGVRYVTVTRFAPKETAAVKWMTVEEHESDESKKARVAYDETVSKRTYAIGEKMPVPPEPQIEKQTTEGSVTDINLANAHALFPPVYWSPGDVIVKNEKSAIWLSDDTFQELVQTRQTVLNFGVLDETANKISKNIGQLRAAYDRLRKQANAEGKDKDLTLLKADADFVNWTLKVNGAETTVSAIRAKNWFGEITVLNNRQNPLVLKLTLNPLLAGASIFNKQEGWSHIFGFEATNIKGQY